MRVRGLGEFSYTRTPPASTCGGFVGQCNDSTTDRTQWSAGSNWAEKSLRSWPIRWPAWTAVSQSELTTKSPWVRSQSLSVCCQMKTELRYFDLLLLTCRKTSRTTGCTQHLDTADLLYNNQMHDKPQWSVGLISSSSFITQEAAHRNTHT